MQITQQTKLLLIISSFMMALAIAIGAFGAHGLKSYLDQYGLDIYAKASSYEFYNTLGLFIIVFISTILKNNTLTIRAYYFVLIGMLIFSFSLYILAVTRIMWLGAITPIGGSLMIIGWLMLAYSIRKN
jgi:uncharacterized membrane protein YgdD (TMEM256/DUF423 family)